MSEALQSLFEGGRLWRGQAAISQRAAMPTGFEPLDHALAGGGWPLAALIEILFPADGVGELSLLMPTLARLSAHGGRIALIAPPYLPYAPAWAAAGTGLQHLQIVKACDKDAAWAAEQCLRSAACAAVLCWPRHVDQQTLRRLQLAAETGQALCFAMRPIEAGAQPSMAAVRICIELNPSRLRILKCRGGNPPAGSIPFTARAA